MPESIDAPLCVSHTTCTAVPFIKTRLSYPSRHRSCSRVVRSHATLSNRQILLFTPDQLRCIPLQERGSHGTVTLSNAGTQAAHFCLVAQSSRQWWDQPSGQDTGLPDWLDVFPISGVVPPQACSTWLQIADSTLPMHPVRRASRFTHIIHV